jgi:hypothetical protein
MHLSQTFIHHSDKWCTGALNQAPMGVVSFDSSVKNIIAQLSMCSTSFGVVFVEVDHATNSAENYIIFCDFPLFNLVPTDVCFVPKKEYPKVNMASIDGC